MNVAQYTFQSPSPNQFQVGKEVLDPTSKDSAVSEDAQLLKSQNSTLAQASSFKDEQTQEPKAKVSSGHSLDIHV